MPKRKQNPLPEKPTAARPATTPEARENQMINLAFDLVEQRLRDGTASASETVHFLKLGARREKLELELLEKEAKLKEAKTVSLESNERIERLFNDAMSAFRGYSGEDEVYDDENDY